jgi:DNA-binding transcriptional MerR regulator
MADDDNVRFADLEGVSRSQIRHWERVGLLASMREAHGSRQYRVFPPETVARIREIARFRRMGLSCAGIKAYLAEKARRAAAGEEPAAQP